MTRSTPKRVKKLKEEDLYVHNRSLWHWYPLGKIQATYSILGGLEVYLEPDEKKLLLGVEEALEKLDQCIRKRYLP